MKRMDLIDYAKSFGMLCVIWGHTMLNGVTNVAVYSFHIPLFFFLSGYVYDKQKYNSLIQLIKRRWKTLLLPYLIFSTITWIIYTLLSFPKDGDFTVYLMYYVQTFIAQGPGGYLVHNYPLWFVTCLFIVEIIYYFISKINNVLNVLISIFCAFVGAFLITKTIWGVLLPWNLEVALAAMPFYMLGNLTRNSKKSFVINRNWLNLIWFLSFVLMVIGAINNGHVSMGSDRLGNPLLFYLTAIFGIVFVLITCKKLTDSKWNKENSKLARSIKWFGANSFYAMAIHVPIRSYVVSVLVRIFGNDIRTAITIDYLLAAVVFMITLIITVIIMNVICYFRNRNVNKIIA